MVLLFWSRTRSRTATRGHHIFCRLIDLFTRQAISVIAICFIIYGIIVVAIGGLVRELKIPVSAHQLLSFKIFVGFRFRFLFSEEDFVFRTW